MRLPGERITAADVNRLLAIFFYAKFGWTVPSAIGRDPAVELQRGSGMSRIMAIVLDVSVCLEVLTKTELSAIYYRWNLLASRDNEDREVARITMLANEAFRAGNEQHYTDLMKSTQPHRRAAGRYVYEARLQENRGDYRRALKKLKIEMDARDLFARAVRGDEAGISA